MAAKGDRLTCASARFLGVIWCVITGVDRSGAHECSVAAQSANSIVANHFFRLRAS
jgi:hypothetical protein